MILGDTSVWIDHLHRADQRLSELLVRDEVATHALVIEVLALGSMREREQVLESMAELVRFPDTSHTEVMTLVNRHRLWGRGLDAVDAHLLSATLLFPGGRLWTRDKLLRAAASDVGADVVPAQ